MCIDLNVILQRLYSSPIAMSPLIFAMMRISASRSSLMCIFKLPLTSLLSKPNPAFASLFSPPPPPVASATGLFSATEDRAPPAFGTLPRADAGPPRPPGALPVVWLFLGSCQHLKLQMSLPLDVILLFFFASHCVLWTLAFR